MPSLPARTIIFNNTIDCMTPTLPTLTTTFNRYRQSASNRQKVLARHLEKLKSSFRNQKKERSTSRYIQKMAHLDKHILHLCSVKEQKERMGQYEDNMRRRKRRMQSRYEAKQECLSLNSSIYRSVEKARVEHERTVDIEREKEKMGKEINAMEERIREKERVYRRLEFYQSKMEELKKQKKGDIKKMLSQIKKKDRDLEQSINQNVTLRLKNKKSARKIQKLRAISKKHEAMHITNPECEY